MLAVSTVRPERRSVNGGDLFRAESLREPARLFAAFIGEVDIGRAGKTIFRGKDSGAVADRGRREWQ